MTEISQGSEVQEFLKQAHGIFMCLELSILAFPGLFPAAPVCFLF